MKLAVVRQNQKVTAIFNTSSEAATFAKNLLAKGVDRQSISCKLEEQETILTLDLGVKDGVKQTVKSFLKGGYTKAPDTTQMKQLNQALIAFGATKYDGGFYRGNHIEVVFNFLFKA